MGDPNEIDALRFSNPALEDPAATPYTPGLDPIVQLGCENCPESCRGGNALRYPAPTAEAQFEFCNNDCTARCLDQRKDPIS